MCYGRIHLWLRPCSWMPRLEEAEASSCDQKYIFLQHITAVSSKQSSAHEEYGCGTYSLINCPLSVPRNLLWGRLLGSSEFLWYHWEMSKLLGKTNKGNVFFTIGTKCVLTMLLVHFSHKQYFYIAVRESF